MPLVYQADTKSVVSLNTAYLLLEVHFTPLGHCQFNEILTDDG